MKLEALRPGDRFRIPFIGMSGRLVSLSSCSAGVVWNETTPRVRTITTYDDEGNPTGEKTFTVAPRQAQIALGTEVEREPS
jgi:hypothetical protein